MISLHKLLHTPARAPKPQAQCLEPLAQAVPALAEATVMAMSGPGEESKVPAVARMNMRRFLFATSAADAKTTWKDDGRSECRHSEVESSSTVLPLRTRQAWLQLAESSQTSMAKFDRGTKVKPTVHRNLRSRSLRDTSQIWKI